MSARMQVPLSQRRHTNIAVVRYTKNGVKLEIACYKNKVISYRSGVETRLDEVLQVERVFTNVSRGFYASEKEIATTFGKATSEEEALRYILVHGELQVAQQERTSEVDQMFKDVAVIISQKCVNSMTQRPFPSQVIEQALRSIGAAVKLDQGVKKQALALIHRLIESQVIPIARALMKMRCTVPDADALVQLSDWCARNSAIVLEKSSGEADPQSLLVLLQPHLLRDLELFVKSALPPGSGVHMVESAVMEFGEGDAMDADLIARANAHAAAADCALSGTTPSAPETSNRTESEGHHVDNDDEGEGEEEGKKKKKRSGKRAAKRDAKRHVSIGSSGGCPLSDEDDEEDNENDAAAHPCATSVGMTGEDSELHSALSKLGLDKCTDVDKKKGENADDADDDDDEDDSGKEKRGKKKQQRRKSGKPQPQQQQQQPKKTVKFELEEGSDEDVLVNRKQRRQAAKAKDDDAPPEDSEFNEEFDYGEED